MDIMPANEFKYGLLQLCDDEQKSFITDRTHALRIWAAYIDADDEAKADCTKMLRADLAELSRRNALDRGSRNDSL